MVTASYASYASVREATPLRLEGQRNVWNPALRAFARRRLGRALGRFSGRIRTVTIWLEDVNGPRGGADKVCRIEIELARRGSVAVSGRASSAYAAIALAAVRARRVLARRFTRLRTQRQKPTQAHHQSPEKIGAQANPVQMLANQSVSPDRSDAPAIQVVEIGSTVTLRDLQSGERDDYTLVPPDQADITRGRISSMTPAGKALYGRAAGDTVAILAPGGIVRVAIDSVRTPVGE